MCANMVICVAQWLAAVIMNTFFNCVTHWIQSIWRWKLKSMWNQSRFHFAMETQCCMITALTQLSDCPLSCTCWLILLCVLETCLRRLTLHSGDCWPGMLCLNPLSKTPKILNLSYESCKGTLLWKYWLSCFQCLLDRRKSFLCDCEQTSLKE